MKDLSKNELVTIEGGNPALVIGLAALAWSAYNYYY